jgi:hypothetical protein
MCALALQHGPENVPVAVGGLFAESVEPVAELRHSRLALTALLFGHFAALAALLFGHFAALAALELKLSLLQPRALIQHCLIVSECGGECV